MCEGEFKFLKAINTVFPEFVPEPYTWSKHAQEDPETVDQSRVSSISKQENLPESTATATRELTKEVDAVSADRNFI